MYSGADSVHHRPDRQVLHELRRDLYEAAATQLRVNQNCHDEWVVGHGALTDNPNCDHQLDEHIDLDNVKIKLRRIGYIDQKGCVWVSTKDWIAAGGPNGSITPLYINPGCD